MIWFFQFSRFYYFTTVVCYLLSDFTQMAVVTSLRLYDSQIFEGRGSWGILHLQRAFFLRSLYDLKNEEYRNRKTKETEKNIL